MGPLPEARHEEASQAMEKAKMEAGYREDKGFRVESLGFRVENLGCWGLGFGVYRVYRNCRNDIGIIAIITPKY